MGTKMRPKARENASLRARQDFHERRLYPAIWALPINPESILGLTYQVLPEYSVLSRLMRSYVKKEEGSSLLLCLGYVHRTKRVPLGYFSERERLVVTLNRYRYFRDPEDLMKGAQMEDQSTSWTPLWHMVNGLVLLHEFTRSLSAAGELKKAIAHLSIADREIGHPALRQVLAAVLSFSHYMNKDFDQSFKSLRLVQDEALERKFESLMLEAA
jgi:hypothetical protein